MDRLIVMDNVSGIADTNKKFAEFLTVSRKNRYHCIYIFHIITPETQIWEKKFSHKQTLLFFHQVCHTILLLKLCKVIVDKH